MGIWGVGLLDDDIMVDINDEFTEYERHYKEKGHESPAAMATQHVLGMVSGLADTCYHGLVYVYLAEKQIERNMLDPVVKENAMKYLESGMDLESRGWDPDVKEERKKMLDELLDKIRAADTIDVNIKAYNYVRWPTVD